MNFGIVLVTGAGRGIGLALVRQLCINENNRIFAACRNPQTATELQSLSYVTDDVDIQNSVDAVTNTFGFLNVLINNAGIYECSSSKLADENREMLQRHFNVNVTSSILLAKAFSELLNAGSEGHPSQKHSLIVNISGRMGSISQTKTGNAYGYRSSKTALNMASKCLGTELVTQGIYCVAIHPGWVKTDMGGKNADLNVLDSARSVLKVMSEITKEHNGKYLDYKGNYFSY